MRGYKVSTVVGAVAIEYSYCLDEDKYTFTERLRELTNTFEVSKESVPEYVMKAFSVLVEEE